MARLGNLLYIVSVAVIFAALFYLLLGVKNLAFVKRQKAWTLFYLTLIFLTLLTFFLEMQNNELFWLKLGGLFFALTVLFRSWLKGSVIWSWSATAISTEMVVVVNFLPIGFIQGATLCFVTVWVLGDLITHYRQKTLEKRILWHRLALFSLLSGVILLTSRWVI